MKHLLLTTIAVMSLLPTNGFAGPIHNAAFSGNAEGVKHYIDAGTDVNAMNKHGWTPLHEAVTGGHKDIADLLIAKGADVNAKEAKNRITPLHWAVWRGRKEIVELLIAKGADLNVKNKDEGTPLHNAAWKGHNEIAKLLIVKGADVNAKDVEGQTPLDWAEEEKHKKIASLLRKHGGKTGEELQPPSQLLPIPDNLVVLTFDDGNKSDFANVPKVLKKHGFGATFYVTEGLGFLKNPQNYLSWEQIRQLHEMGYEIGNHTQHHRNVSHLKSEELAASLAHIDKRCAENKITKPVTFCYPGFRNNHASVKVLEKHGFLFARRGVGPEYKDPGKGARGPAYDPKVDDPLLVPTTGYAGPDWKMKDLKWAIDQAEDGKITVLCFHGIPAIEHPWVSTDLKDFEKYMQYLKDEGCTVIAMRDLAKYVNPNHRPHKADPYQPVRKRVAEMKRKAAKKE